MPTPHRLPGQLPPHPRRTAQYQDLHSDTKAPRTPSTRTNSLTADPQPHEKGAPPNRGTPFLTCREISPSALPPALKLADVLAELGMSRAAFYRMRARGQAPKCIRLPNGQLRFRRADIDKWLTEHEEAIAC